MFLRPRSWLPARAIQIYDAHRFELATIWGQFWQRRYADVGLDYLQVGSYESRLPGFLNTDHFSNRDADFHLDIRYPLPFADARWAGIFAHHIVEHVRYEEALSFFREAHRVLKRSGTLRIVVPDAQKFLEAYGSSEAERIARFLAIMPPGHLDSVRPQTALGFVNFAFYCGGWNEHRSAWDFETMATALGEAGFSRIERAECGQSRDTKMSGIDTAHWAEHSLYVEAVKTAD